MLSRSDLLGGDDHSIRLGLRTQWDAGGSGDLKEKKEEMEKEGNI